MKTIQVNTGRPYRIQIGSGLLDQAPALIAQAYGDRRPRLAVITDDTVDQFYGDHLTALLERAGYPVCKFVFPHGEQSKNLQTVHAVYGFLSENGITRTDVVVALGGGVVGDLAGFAAATWLRSVDFIQIPTTFLSMIDSSVGGKTGVDIPQGKNLVGAFWQPSLVICDPSTLDTLPAVYFSDGIAEAVKYGAILDDSLFRLFEEGRLREQLTEVIARCIDLKRLVVEQDERDTGLRQQLNFGHTFGHAIEKQAQFTITHGQGVAIGMVLISHASERAGLTPTGTADRIRSCLRLYGLPTSTDYPIGLLCQNAMGDKKRSGSKIKLVVLERIGQATLHPVDTDRLLSFMTEESDA